MPKIAVFAGSFCPFTKGHEDVVAKALPLFDKIYIAVGHNFQKKDFFSVEQRINWIQQLYASNDKIEVVHYEGLTIDICHQVKAQYMIRGLRNAADYAAEQEIALVNLQLAADITTIFIPTSPQWAAVSSSLVRELWSLNADYTPFVSFPLPEK